MAHLYQSSGYTLDIFVKHHHQSRAVDVIISNADINSVVEAEML